MHQPQHLLKSSKITPVTAVTEIEYLLTWHNALPHTRPCTMASLARCLNKTLVQQLQEEAE